MFMFDKYMKKNRMKKKAMENTVKFYSREKKT